LKPHRVLRRREPDCTSMAERASIATRYFCVRLMLRSLTELQARRTGGLRIELAGVSGLSQDAVNDGHGVARDYDAIAFQFDANQTGPGRRLKTYK
jgi:hypothetical protein